MLVLLYIQLQQGTSREAIKNNLLTQGWQQQEINEAFSETENQSTMTQPNVMTGDASKNGKAITSLVFGVIGLMAWLIPLKGATGQNSFVNEFLKGVKEGVKDQQVDNTSSANLESQPYINSQAGFTIRAPKGWRVDESGLFGALVIFLNTQIDQEGTNLYGANIYVISESARGLGLDDYVNATKEALPKLPQNHSTEDKKVSVNGVQARIIGEAFVQGVFHLRDLQLIVVKNDKAYTVTANVLESTWNKYKDLIEASLLTFELN